MLSNWAIKQLEHLTLDYLKLDCAGGKCYGILAVSDSLVTNLCLFATVTDICLKKVHRVCFALVLFHAIIGLLVLGVRDSRQKRAALQNG